MKFVIASVVLSVCVSQIYSASLCGFGDGKDMCSPGGSNCMPMVVRPRELPKLKIEDIIKPRVVCKQVGGLPALKPIGDLCSCRQSIVQPAIIPRPACPSCSLSSSVSLDSISHQSHHLHQEQHHQQEQHQQQQQRRQQSTNTQAVYGDNDYVQGEEVFMAPADPVSLSLAYKLQNQNQHSNMQEGRLNFGFRKLPVDGCRIKTCKKFPEENLFKLNGKVVELRPVTYKRAQLSIDDEAMEDLMAGEFEDSQHFQEEGEGASRHLTYGDLGFVSAKYQKVPMVAVECSGASSSTDANSDHHHHESCAECNDGYVPGNVEIRNIPRQEIYVGPPTSPLDCEDVEYEAIDVVKPIKYVSSSSYGSSSSSRTSNKAYQMFAMAGQ